MLLLSKSFENLLQSAYYPDVFLPPLWQVIYQEGVRANHILFESQDVYHFLEEQRSNQSDMSDGESETVCLAVLNILRSCDLSTMRAVIAALTLSQKRTCFQLYLHALQFWKDHLKTKLN